MSKGVVQCRKVQRVYYASECITCWLNRAKMVMSAVLVRLGRGTCIRQLSRLVETNLSTL